MDEGYDAASRVSDRFYHATPQTNESKIDVDGLTPQFRWRHSYTNGVGTTHETTRTWEIDPIHLTLGVSWEELVSELHDADEVVVYEVDVHGLTLETGYDGPGSFTVREWIEPRRLTKVSTYRRVLEESA